MKIFSARVVAYLWAIALVTLLSACGGGGSGTAPASAGGAASTTSAKLTLAASTDTISATAPATVSATLRDARGAAVVGAVVTFATQGTGFGVFYPTGGTALTNSAGVATISLNAGTQIGADAVIASATVSGVKISSDPLGYTVNAVPITSTAASITFTSASPTTIAIQGTGGQETSIVSFTVRDTSGNPLPNQVVAFALTSTVGILESELPHLAPSTATSAADGSVSTVVTSGAVATPVRVRATLVSNGAITTVSSQLVISTALPHKRGFGLAYSYLSPPSCSSVLVCATVTVLVADRNGNFVPDGTAVSFRTQRGIGLIGPSCFTVSGTCSVQFSVAKNQVPPGSLIQVLATAIGEDSFTDLNGNGRYDAGEPTDTLSEAYIDANHNGMYDLGEEFVDYNRDGIWNSAPSSPAFRGVLRTDGIAPSTIIVWKTVDIPIL